MRLLMLLLACSACLAAPPPHSPAAPEATVCSGRLQGKWLRSRAGRAIAAFQSIPYAAPPVGDLRFRAPELPLLWKGVRNATALGPICTQRSSLDSPDVVGEEDCLFINVYAPKGASNVDVVVYIHGGAFLVGSGNLYMPEYLLDKDVILVTFNYRIGPLGFLTTGDDIIPGNLGLKDQVRALQWVQANIKAFGGNPASVTIQGQSAGASSTHLLTLSPLAKGLFHKAIMQSGSALCPWTFAQPGEDQDIAARLAGVLGCPAEPSTALRDCLLGLSDTSIQAADYGLFGFQRLAVSMARPGAEPVGTEGAFITGYPEEILAASGPQSDVPLIFGFNAQDGGDWYEGIQCNESLLEYFNKNFDTIVPTMLNVQPLYVELVQPSIKQLRKFYYGADRVSHNKRVNSYDLFTDALFLWPTVRSIKLLLKLGRSPIYFHEFAHESAATPNQKGVLHNDDLKYVFPMTSDIVRTKDDVKVSKTIIQLISNFMSTGSPTVNGTWSRVLDPEAAEYFRIDSPDYMRLHSNVAAERMQMWKQLPVLTEEEAEVTTRMP